MPLTRRRFVTGALGLAGAYALPGPLSSAHASHSAYAAVRELRGTEFALDIGAMPVNFTGREAWADAVNGSLPAPTLRWREGDTVSLRVSNRLREDTSLHWHGILLPANMDGVPGLSFHGIAPGESFLYRFTLRQSGTYWYHAHSSLQEAKGVYGAIVIEPTAPDPVAADRDYVLLLSDWSDEDPHAIVRKLKIQSDYYNRSKQTVGDFLRDARRDGLRETLADRAAWGRMRMSPTDLADVTALAYTYLCNGVTPDGNWTGAVRARRARAPAFHQRFGDDLLRRAHSRPEDDRGGGRRPTGASGERGRIPDRRRRDARRRGDAGRGPAVHRCSRRRWIAAATRARRCRRGSGWPRRCPRSIRARC